MIIYSWFHFIGLLGLLTFHACPILKLVIGLCVLAVVLVVYVIVRILGSIVGGAAYGFLPPIFATFEAIQEGKVTNLSTGKSLYVYIHYSLLNFICFSF